MIYAPERGISAEAIVAHLSGCTGLGTWGSDHPHDPSDFRRCQLVARQVSPKRFADMRTRSEVWARLVDHWQEIHEAIEAEAPGYVDRFPLGESARLGYQLMRRVIAGLPACAACEGSGRAEACPKCKGSGRRSGGRCRATGCFDGHRLCRSCSGYGYDSSRELAS